MKKLMMIFALMCSVNASAQWFVSGSAGIGYLNDEFQLLMKSSAGYEFNERWAAGLGVGVGVYGEDGNVGAIFDPFVRFNCWNNSKFFVDAKAETEVWFGNGGTCYANIGFVPSLRYAINNHWQVAGDVGLIGAQYIDDCWCPAFGFTSASVKMSVIYRF